MHLFQGHRTSSEPLWHVGLPPLFTQAYIHSLHRFLAHFMICDDYFMISSGFPLIRETVTTCMAGVHITHFANELRHHDMAKTRWCKHGAKPTHLGSFHAHAIPNTPIELQSGPTTKF